MKKIALLAFAAGLGFAFAGGVDNKTNLNQGYMRNPSRNTETLRPEAVLYNIGGTAFMNDGLYFELGNQFVLKNYSDKLDGQKFEDDQNVYFYPNAEVVYKKDNWAAFFGFGVFGGGGTLDYSDGTGLTSLALQSGFANKLKASLPLLIASGACTLQTAASYIASASAKMAAHSLEVYSVQLGEILGASYKINDMISVAAAGRFKNITLKCDGLQSVNGGSSKIGYESNGYGFGGIFGVHIKPWNTLDVGIQYQTITKLKYKYDDLTGAYASSFLNADEGDNFKNDLPAVLNLGVGYTFFDKLNASMSFNYYFNKQATIESPIDRSEYDYDDSWEIALGSDYRLNEQLSFGTGFSYGKQGSKSDVNNVFSPVLDNFVIGAGVEYSPVKLVTISGSAMYCKYFSEDYKKAGYTMELSKDVVMLALGVTVKPF
ncbi:outer membrane protein transport protein [Treponema sp.]|uniref:OmpP1/FadL family transporter n=1 Tax=Treponema sp. TaxID=166 RepID=UPI00257BBA66|nr:outer membrane protein transport protein [Treponema sp.]